MSFCSGLEDDLRTELRVEGFTSTDAGGSVIVADGVIEGEVTAGGDVATAGRREVGSVEEVEHLGAQLDGDSLLDAGVLEDGEVDVRVARTVVTVAAGGAECTRSGIAEGVGIEPIGVRILTLITLVWIADLHRAIIAFVGAADVAGGVHGEGLTTVQADQAVDGPAVRKSARTM